MLSRNSEGQTRERIHKGSNSLSMNLLRVLDNSYQVEFYLLLFSIPASLQLWSITASKLDDSNFCIQSLQATYTILQQFISELTIRTTVIFNIYSNVISDKSLFQTSHSTEVVVKALWTVDIGLLELLTRVARVPGSTPGPAICFQCIYMLVMGWEK